MHLERREKQVLLHQAISSTHSIKNAGGGWEDRGPLMKTNAAAKTGNRQASLSSEPRSRLGAKEGGELLA